MPLTVERACNGWIVRRLEPFDDLIPMRWVFADAKAMAEWMAQLDNPPPKPRDAP